MSFSDFELVFRMTKIHTFSDTDKKSLCFLK